PFTGTQETTPQHVQAAHRWKPRPRPPGGSVPRQLQGTRTHRVPGPAIHPRNRADTGAADRQHHPQDRGHPKEICYPAAYHHRIV
ncbi:MAG: hypothetical protein ACK56I_12655, partial [bacterium]